MTRVWLLTNAPSPYQVEFLRAVQAGGRVHLDVRFMRDDHRGERVLSGVPAGFAYRVPRAVGPAFLPDAWRWHPGTLRDVLRGEHDAYVLSGHYTSVSFMACALGLHCRRASWSMWLERPWPEDYRPAWATKASARSGIARWTRSLLLKRLVRMAPRILCIGSAAVQAYRRFGAAPENLAVLPYHCDVARFARATADEGRAARERMGIAPASTVFLYSGALIERKGVDTLLAAFARVRARTDTELLLLGDGRLRTALEASLAADVRRYVHFAGHVPQEGLPAMFAAADAFVFLSRHDGWAVVVNEAAGAGLPLIVTRQTGAACDLVEDGVNGYVVERDDVRAAAERMEHLARHPETARAMGERSRERAQAFGLQAGVERFESLIGAAAAGGG